MNIAQARQIAINEGLDAPDWALDSEVPIDQIRARIGSEGGCGPGNFWDWFVPDSNWFLNMKPVCYCHDCDYRDAKTEAERNRADLRFFTNGAKYIRRKSANFFTRWLRLRRWGKYYRAVDFGGGGCFG